MEEFVILVQIRAQIKDFFHGSFPTSLKYIFAISCVFLV